MSTVLEFPIHDRTQTFYLNVPNFAYSLRVTLAHVDDLLLASADWHSLRRLADYDMRRDHTLHLKVQELFQRLSQTGTRRALDEEAPTLKLVEAQYACGVESTDRWLVIRYRLETDDLSSRPRPSVAYWRFYRLTTSDGASGAGWTPCVANTVEIPEDVRIDEEGSLLLCLPSFTAQAATTQWGVISRDTPGWPSVLWQRERWLLLARINQLLHEDRYSALRGLLKSGEPSKTLAEQLAAQLRALHHDVTAYCTEADAIRGAGIWASLHVLLEDAAAQPTLPLAALRVLPLTRALAEQVAEALSQMQKLLPQPTRVY